MIKSHLYMKYNIILEMKEITYEEMKETITPRPTTKKYSKFSNIIYILKFLYPKMLTVIYC